MTYEIKWRNCHFEILKLYSLNDCDKKIDGKDSVSRNKDIQNVLTWGRGGGLSNDLASPNMVGYTKCFG